MVHLQVDTSIDTLWVLAACMAPSLGIEDPWDCDIPGYYNPLLSDSAENTSTPWDISTSHGTTFGILLNDTFALAG